jgi:hypothetical protein
MLTQLKTLIRRVDFYLRNEPYRPATGKITLRPIDDLFDKEEGTDPLRTRVYWGIRRFWNHHWLCNPRDIYYGAKYAYQRLTRGWDDRAVWSIDWWLDDKMPAMLRKLKEDKHGIPGDMFEGLPTKPDEPWNHTDEAYALAEARWDAILDKMIAAFEASRRMQNLTYEDELGDYPLYRPAGVAKEDWKKVQHDRFLASELLRERDMKIHKEGMALFVEHYSSLWD